MKQVTNQVMFTTEARGYYWGGDKLIGSTFDMLTLPVEWIGKKILITVTVKDPADE